MDKPTVLIAEDDFMIREGCLEPLLKPHFVIVASVGDGQEAVAASGVHHPNIALLDVSLPGLRGFEAARRILSAQPDCKVLIVSNYADSAYVDAAKEMGASGYVLKTRIHSELLAAIQTAMDGGFHQSVI
jgi:two-component system, NarL family, response regulator DesR